MNDFKKHVKSASAWVFLGYFLSQVIRLIANLVLTRLLIPEDFGIMALILLLMQGLGMFSDVGIGLNIIRSKSGDKRKFLNTAWTMQVLRGILLWICACILAKPFSLFYGEQLFLLLIPVASLTALINGFTSTALFTENRSLNLSRITVVEIVSQLCGTSVMVGWALVVPSVWALVGGSLISSLIKVFLSHTIFGPINNKLQWDKKYSHEIIEFGKWIFLSSVFSFIAQQIDRLALGKLVSLDLLGIYTIGVMWSQAPIRFIQILLSRVYFPILSKLVISDELEKHQIISSFRSGILFIAAPAIAGLVFVIPIIIDLLYLPIYKQSGLIGAILTTGAWIRLQSLTYGSILYALGKPKFMTFGTIATTFLFLTMFISLYDLWGINGIAFAAVFSLFGLLLFSFIGVHALGFSNLKIDIYSSGLFSFFLLFFYGIKTLSTIKYNSLFIDLLLIGFISILISLFIGLLYIHFNKQNL